MTELYEVGASADDPRAPTPAAWRRPGLVAFAYGYRALVGLLVALPVAVAVGGPVASWPRGQRELFDPGGVMLLESLRLARRSFEPVEIGAALVALVALLAGVFPLAALLVGLARKGRLPVSFLAGRATSHVGTLALLSAAALPAQAVAGGLVGYLGGKLVDALHLEAPFHDLATAASVAVALGAVCLVGVLRDLAFAAAVRGEHRFYVAASRALRVGARSWGRALFAWGWRSASGLGALGLAAMCAPALAGSAGGALLAAFLLHQAAIFATTFARASWLAAAMRLYDASQPRA